MSEEKERLLARKEKIEQRLAAIEEAEDAGAKKTKSARPSSRARRC